MASFVDQASQYLPEIKGPKKRLSFKDKLKWSLIVLGIFFFLGMIPLYGLGQNSLQRFEFLSTILAANFGSLLSLGIGPLVTSSIVLQLLNGSNIINFDLNSQEGKTRFQNTQKLLSIGFIVFEAIIYVMMGGLSPSQQLAGTSAYFGFQLVLMFQLFLGGMLLLFMDELISKWGFGSGISLFIAAGVAQQVFTAAFNPFTSQGSQYSIGALPALFQSLSAGDPQTALLELGSIISTIVVFLVVVYTQSMKVEIPLSMGRVRGHGVRWPLKFYYTSNIPVILVSALLANLQLWGRLLENWGMPILGTFSGGQPASGFVSLISAPNALETVATTGFVGLTRILPSVIVYSLVMAIGSMIFSIFWMQTSNMDAEAQAEKIMSSGLQIPGFRNDKRILAKILDRYVWPLTIIGGLAVGLLAALADLTGALSRGTGILLAVMITYNLYEEIAQQHMMDMHPALRNFMEDN